MTDDEAFVRAIVDRPGDELPRLVYADWLDERGDPRGAYLRAEVAWAKDPSPERETHLRSLGSDCNAVWDAQVARPPVGVCSSALMSTRRNLHATAALTALEERLRVALPVQYRAFVLNTFDGDDRRFWVPVRMQSPEPRAWGAVSDTDRIVFRPVCGFVQSSRTSERESVCTLDMLTEQYVHYPRDSHDDGRFLAIAGDEYGALWIGLQPPYTGEVVYHDGADDCDWSRPAARTLGELLNSLTFADPAARLAAK